jgi:5-methylthioadenosine/S-adenosylhomocysteine deaminase
MAGILITGALIIPMDEGRPDYFTGDLLVEKDRIAAVSDKPGSVDRSRAGRIIDGRNLVLMPGLINTHGHAAMTLFRGYADDLPLKEWLEAKIWPLEANLQGDDVYWGAMLSIAEMLKGGTTTFTDMYFFMDRVAAAAAESKIRAVLARGLIGVGGGSENSLREAEELFENWHGAAGGRISITLGPHAPYTCPPAFLRRVMALADRTGLPLQIHLSETAGEVRDCLQEHGCSPVQLMNRLGLLAYNVIAAHCVHLDERDIAVLAENKVGVAHNPGSNLKLGSGIAPAAALLSAGVKVGLGTDGAASNNNLDLLEEVRLAALLAKGAAREPTLIPAKTALQMATAGGAAVLSLPDTGRLKEGFKADIAGFDLAAPHMAPLHDPLAQLVYAATAGDASLVLVDGEVLVENKELTFLDETKICAEASRRAYRLTGRK